MMRRKKIECRGIRKCEKLGNRGQKDSVTLVVLRRERNKYSNHRYNNIEMKPKL